MPKRFGLCLYILTGVIAMFATSVDASVIHMDTVMGSVYVRLYDESTPATVENFLNYVNDGDYDGSFVHRSVPGFIVQGGGFTWKADDTGVDSIESDAAVVNEPVHSNVRGTIAMAKIGDDENSATNQWFFNLEDNSENLDNQNGGFTVFGEVLGDGMEVVDAISDLMLVNAGGSFSSLPVRDWDQTSQIVGENLVVVNSIKECAAGDVDCDGEVGLLDLDILGGNYGKEYFSWGEGDLDNDGSVGLLDLDILGVNYDSDVTVPEPSGLLALILSGMACISRRKRGK